MKIRRRFSASAGRRLCANSPRLRRHHGKARHPGSIRRGERFPLDRVGRRPYLPAAIAAPRRGVFGAIAQLGERLNGIQEVGGSTPPGSTKFSPLTQRVSGLYLSDALPRPAHGITMESCGSETLRNSTSTWVRLATSRDLLRARRKVRSRAPVRHSPGWKNSKSEGRRFKSCPRNQKDPLGQRLSGPLILCAATKAARGSTGGASGSEILRNETGRQFRQKGFET